MIKERASYLNFLFPYLAKESPMLSRKEKLYFVLLVGLFMFLFLLFFQPFGVNNYDPGERINSKLLLGLSFVCLLTTLLLAFNEFIVFPLIFRQPSRGQMLFWIIWSMIFLGSGIFLLYNYMGEWHDFYLSSYFEFLGNISILSLIPVASLLLYVKVRELNRSLDSVHAYTPQPLDADSLLILTAENQKDRFTLPLKLLLYIASDGNYIMIHHLQDNRPVKTLFRKSLKSTQEEAMHPTLLRCHRSYVINLLHLQQIHGNRNNLKVYINHVASPIPVSRQYMDAVFNLIAP
mgnify:CR=1 FL=1